MQQEPQLTGDSLLKKIPKKISIDFLLRCIRSTEPGSEKLKLKLELIRRLRRPELNYECKQSLWIAISILEYRRQHGKKDLSSADDDEDEEMMDFETLRNMFHNRDPSTAYPYLFSKTGIIPSLYGVDTYSGRTFRSALESLMKFICENHYHHEMRKYYEDLRRYCLCFLMIKTSIYEIDDHTKISEIPVFDPLFNDTEWCIRRKLHIKKATGEIIHAKSSLSADSYTTGGNSCSSNEDIFMMMHKFDHKENDVMIRVVFSCNENFFLATETYFYHMDELLRTRERWKHQLIIQSLSPKHMLIVFDSIFNVITANVWYTDLVQEAMAKEFGSQFLYPGEEEIVKIMDPDAKILSPVHVMSRTRPTILTKITVETVSKNPKTALEERRKCISNYAENSAIQSSSSAAAAEEEKSISGHILLPEDHINTQSGGGGGGGGDDDRSEFYDWRHSYIMNGDLNQEITIKEHAYILFFIISAKKVDDINGDMIIRRSSGISSSSSSSSSSSNKINYKIQDRMKWNPKNPKFWIREHQFPFLVQTNDYRYHVAVDHETLLICPNIETAYYIWTTLSTYSSERRRRNTSSSPSTSSLTCPTTSAEERERENIITLMNSMRTSTREDST